MTPQVRLQPYEIEAIIQCFRTYFPENDHLWLFGSRVCMDKRGGDIDLYMETNLSDSSNIRPLKSKFLSALQERIGEQKIDLIVRRTEDSLDKTIYQEEKSTGVLLT